MAVTTRLFQNLYSTYHKRIMKFDLVAKILVSFQHYLFLPVLSFGRFNLVAQSLNFLLNFSTNDGREWRWMELTGMATFFTWFYYGLVYCCIPTWSQRILFAYLANAFTMVLHLQITISHFAMSTTKEEEEELFLTKALRTTMNGIIY
jgi:delta8-fatty-acid desaturase